MPSFEYSRISSATRDTPASVSGPLAGPAVQNGNDIQDDKVRYIWRIRCLNTDGLAAHDLIIYAGDAANTQRRIIYRTTIPAAGTLDYPVNAKPTEPILRVPPNTGVTPTQENGIYVSDEAGGGLIAAISMSYYDLRA